MMSKSYQNEIPKARVNIALAVETQGATEKKELPLKLLAMADYGAGKNTEAVQNRERISINKNNFDQVMSDLSPTVKLSVANKLDKNGGDLPVELTFRSMKDFSPEQVAQNIPELKKLVGMRNLLKDLKSNLLDNAKFRRELEAIFNNDPALQHLRAELDKLVEEK